MWLYYLAKTVCMIAFSLFFHLEYRGVENIPASGPYILISNHRSNLDPILLAHKVRGQARYMGKMELFRNPIMGWALRTIGTFPVDRGSGDSSAIDNAQAVIREGDILGIFPEGHRSKDGQPLRPKSGMALIAKLTGASVLPCSVYWEGKLGFRRKIIIRYGELLPFETLGLEGDSPRDLRNSTKRMFDRVLELLEESRNEY
ncbi:MAG: 1-acyl-sn-glycerol-3-phosphate acyltransferase [Clostridiales bacterium]|nr:1-acyl-sn-glycerol-3-phosphate acyltransferase [Clostridiales bacterium]